MKRPFTLRLCKDIPIEFPGMTLAHGDVLLSGPCELAPGILAGLKDGKAISDGERARRAILHAGDGELELVRCTEVSINEGLEPSADL